ncbi:hypothetical protein A9Q75_15390 [Colwellia psychrerythraea]|uniref:Ice-binding protein C-terminal domain-containing protein n=1 Tax=Colwellia psychrerythraea TaxID=28229 RepID=A0A1Y5E4J1_COLPS|nr:hypothetical protein A9Q75_15390 [Colwellia psychrerythraea]
MLKSFKKISIILLSVIAFNASAGTIPTSVVDISDNYYVSYNGYDIMWVSATSYQFLWSGFEPTDIQYSDYQDTVYQNTDTQNNIIYNQLLSSNFNGGDWQYFEELGLTGSANDFLIDIYESEFGLYTNGVSLLTDLFYEGGQYKHAFEFWNATTENSLLILDDIQFNGDFSFASQREHESGEDWDAEFKNSFYIRQSAPTQPVPEPSTLMIFALGLVALASRKKLLS